MENHGQRVQLFISAVRSAISFGGSVIRKCLYYILVVLFSEKVYSLEIDIGSAITPKQWEPEAGYDGGAEKRHLDEHYKPIVIEKLKRCYSLNTVNLYNIEGRTKVSFKFIVKPDGSIKDLEVKNQKYPEIKMQFYRMINECAPFIAMPFFDGKAVGEYEVKSNFILHQEEHIRNIPIKARYRN